MSRWQNIGNSPSSSNGNTFKHQAGECGVIILDNLAKKHKVSDFHYRLVLVIVPEPEFQKIIVDVIPYAVRSLLRHNRPMPGDERIVFDKSAQLPAGADSSQRRLYRGLSVYAVCNATEYGKYTP